MRIAISADENTGLGSAVSAHFGRCPCYVLVDLEDREVKKITTVANPFYGQHAPGQVPAFIFSQEVETQSSFGQVLIICK